MYLQPPIATLRPCWVYKSIPDIRTKSVRPPKRLRSLPEVQVRGTPAQVQGWRIHYYADVRGTQQRMLCLYNRA